MNNSSRGINKLYKDLVNDTTDKKVEQRRIGRSCLLIAKRNECLIERYLFYIRTNNTRYEELIKILSDEFFISYSTITGLLNDNYETLTKIKKEYQEYSNQKLKTELQKKWFHLNWKA